MKTKLFTFAIIVLLIISGINAKAQYCFWVANQTDETFDGLKVRTHGTGESFGDDLLPNNSITPGHHYWVKVYTGEQLWDVQITRRDGTVLLFTYTDRGGTRHINQRFITVNARLLHTLVIQGNDDGSLSFAYYETDQLDYGSPCQ